MLVPWGGWFPSSDTETDSFPALRAHCCVKNCNGRTEGGEVSRPSLIGL